jgi:prepilin-type N-terminal cleavage/methylation domain-containing protein
MRRFPRKEAGVTLIELMVAITLVAALSSGMLMAIRTSLMTLEKVDSRLQFNRRVMSVQQILSRQIGGVMPVQGECTNSGRVSVFNGNPQTLHLVSTYSMSEGARGYPQVLELQVIPDGGAGVRLIVNEYLYSGPASTAPFCVNHQFLPAQPNPHSFVLADRLAYCRFIYHDVVPDDPMAGNWLPAWDKPNLPSAVRVDLAPLAADPMHLYMVPVTVPIHIHREVAVPYVDTP